MFISLADNPFFSECIAYVYCGLTDEEALRLASRHNINGHYTHEMTHKDYVSYVCFIITYHIINIYIYICSIYIMSIWGVSDLSTSHEGAKRPRVSGQIGCIQETTGHRSLKTFRKYKRVIQEQEHSVSHVRLRAISSKPQFAAVTISHIEVSVQPTPQTAFSSLFGPLTNCQVNVQYFSGDVQHT